ncbi:MAG: RsmB/NOP family class I SAM-dependent RNA methyltransferase [Bacillota bacterium]
MKSYTRLREKLPPVFIRRLYDQFEPPQAEQIMAGFMENRPLTLRINTLKTDIRKVMEIFKADGVKFDRVNWDPAALIIKNAGEKDLESHDLYKSGGIYLQSLASMIPPLVLNPAPGAKILDLAAAPGSKSTQLAALMQNRGFILANEKDKIRGERLRYNLNKQGVRIAEIRLGDGKRLESNWHGFFDAALLDAPCSGEGLFQLENPRTYRFWSDRLVAKMSGVQKKLFLQAFLAVKPGGRLVYSTCTINREENENVVLWALAYCPGLAQERIILAPSLPAIYSRGIMRILPSRLTEGFFVACFRKLKA